MVLWFTYSHENIGVYVFLIHQSYIRVCVCNKYNNIHSIIGNQAELFMYFHICNNHSTFFNIYIISQLHCDLLTHMRIYKDKYFECLMYIKDYLFNIKIIIFRSLLVMNQYYLYTFTRTIIIVQFWIICPFLNVTEIYLSA